MPILKLISEEPLAMLPVPVYQDALKALDLLSRRSTGRITKKEREWLENYHLDESEVIKIEQNTTIIMKSGEN